MRLLLDSNVLLWSFADRKLLTPKVLQLIEEDTNDLIVSRASIWEIALKVAKGNLTIPGSSVRSLLDQIEIIGMSILPIENSHIHQMEKLPHILAAASLPQIHHDPGNRLLVAQPLAGNIPRMTLDPEICDYAVPTIW